MALTDKLTAIADALRAKTGETDFMTLAQIPDKISGITFSAQEKTATKNGTITPDHEFDGLSAVHVDVCPEANDVTVTMTDGTTTDFSAIMQLISDTKLVRTITIFGKPFWNCTNFLPHDYIRLSHIIANGSQAIDTGYTLTPNTNLEVDCCVTADGVIMGMRHNFPVSSDDRTFVVTLTPSGNKLEEWFRRPGYVSAGSLDNMEPIRAIRKWQGSKYSIDYMDDTYPDKSYEKALSGEYMDWTCPKEHTIHLCGNIEYNDANGNFRYQFSKGMLLYGCKIFEGDTIVRDFIPCLNPDGVAGVYDCVTQAFFGSVGTGQFLAGDPLSTELNNP